VGHLRAYRDVGESTNLELGGSFAYGHNGVTDDTTTRSGAADLTLRWKPLRRSIYTHFLARGELAWSAARGRGRRAGFGRRLRLPRVPVRPALDAGVRYDNSERAADSRRPRPPGGRSSSAIARASSAWCAPSTAARRSATSTRPATSFLFQFLFAIGAHGAHPF
jgi:hypothetical protein